MKESVEHQGRDVHATRGCSGANDDPQARADTHPTEGSAQDHVLRDSLCRQHALPQLQKHGVEQTAQHRGGRKLPPQHRQPQQQHHHIEAQHERGDRDRKAVPHKQRDSGGPPGDQPAGQQEGRHAEGVQGISQYHQQKIQAQISLHRDPSFLFL